MPKKLLSPAGHEKHEKERCRRLPQGLRLPAMSGTPPDICIDDLASPNFTPAQLKILEETKDLKVEMSEEAVLQAAIAQTGLKDFGSEDFRERMRVWLQAVAEDSSLRPAARFGIFSSCVRNLKNRLRLEDLLKKHPEILETKIECPIIIVGLPRSGTTHLLNLMAADSRLRSLPYWESLEPIPVPEEKPGPGEEDPRITRCREAYRQQDEMMPLLRAMHDMRPGHIHEEIELLEMDFGSYGIEWIAHVPSWRDYYLSLDLGAQYEYLAKALQALQWMRGPKRWVLKSPQHLEQLAPLDAVFPDATIAFTHRDPVSVIQSAITMLGYGDRMRCKKVNLPQLADYWSSRIERLLRACVRDRKRIPAARSIDVLFHEFMADDIGMVERIYQLAGLPMTAAARAQLEACMQESPRGKHGRVRYDLRGDFGINPDALRERFAFYFEKFPVQAERD